MAGENQGPLVAIAVFQASWAMTAKAPRNRRVATMRRWRGMGNPFVNRCPVWRYKRPSSVSAGDNHPGFRGPASMTMTAMATLAMSAATKVTSSLNLPEPDDILIEAGGWRVLVQLLGNGFTLTCVLPADENLGLVKLAMQARGREIREIIDDIV